MAILPITIEGFAAGDAVFDAVYTAFTNVKADGVSGFPTHWSNFGDHHSLKIGSNNASARWEGRFRSSDWQTYMFQMYIGADIPSQKTLFHTTKNGTNRNWYLAINDDYDLLIKDAGGSTVLDSSGFFEADNWYLFRVKCKRSNSGEFVMFINKPGEPVQEVYRDATMDTLNASGSTSQTLVVPTSVTGEELYYSDLYQSEDDGANIDTNDTMLGAGINHRYTVQDWVCRHYKTAETGTARDFGTKDPVGNFTKTEDQPPSDATECTLEYFPGVGDQDTGIYKDHATGGGPKLDAPEDPVAARWSWRYKVNDASKTGTNFRVQYGNKDDSLIVGSWLSKSTTYKYVAHIEGFDSANPGVVPTASQYFAIGWSARDNGGIALRKSHCADMYAVAMCPETARRMVHTAGNMPMITSDPSA